MKFAFCMFIIGSNGSAFLLAPAEKADPWLGCVLAFEQNKANLKEKHSTIPLLTIKKEELCVLYSG